MIYKEELFREPKMTEGCKVHLPVAYPRTALASWISAYPQRFWITGRLCLFYHISPRFQGLVDTSPGRLYSTCLTHSGVATARRHHAGSHFAPLDRPSHRGPHTSRPGWRQLSPFSDGRDPETFPRRSRPFFGITQIPIQ